MVWISESLLNWKTGFNKETIVIVPSKRPFSMLIYSPMCSLWRKNGGACFSSPVVILGGRIFQHALWLPKLMCLYIFMHAQTISVCVCGQEKFHFSKLHREIKAFSLCWNLFITKILLRTIPWQSGNPFSNQPPASSLQLPSSPPMSPWLQAHTDWQGIRITSRRSECRMTGSDPDPRIQALQLHVAWRHLTFLWPRLLLLHVPWAPILACSLFFTLISQYQELLPLLELAAIYYSSFAWVFRKIH